MTASDIIAFRGEYRFLSNFWTCTIHLDAFVYPSVEHAYQAAKSIDPNYRLLVRDAFTPADAKQLGRKAQLRPGWEDARLGIMYQLVRQKFVPDRVLGEKLLETCDAYLCEGNTWGDRFWGTCSGVGMNHLGRILMRVREELRSGN